MSGDEKTCTTDTDCDENESCIDRICVRDECTTREDCQGPVCLVCVESKCAAPPPVCQGNDDCCIGYHCNFGFCAADTEGCQSDADCQEPDKPRCVNGDCMPECLSDLDCGGGKVCVDQKCVSPGCTPEQCAQGQWCDPDAADGMGACMPGCDSHEDCESGKLCNYDTHECMDDCCGGCAPEEYCDTAECICKPKCENDADCPEGFVCNQPTGECLHEGGQEGDTCSVDDDCGEGLLCDNCNTCDWLAIPATMSCLYQCSLGIDCPRSDLACKGPRRADWKFLCLPANP
jgi:hypothetical protein